MELQQLSRTHTVLRHCLVLMLTVFSSEMAVWGQGGGGGAAAAVSAAAMGCPQHFEYKVIECLDPYWSVAALYNSHGSAGSISVALAKHLCLQFEIALACLHTALTECPSHSNMQYVQSKLGSDWAMEIRNLCVGQSELSTNQVPGEGVERAKQRSAKLLQDYLNDVDVYEESTVDDNVVVGKEIIVIVPGDNGDFHHDLIVDVRDRVKLKPRHDYHRSHEQALDIKVYNIFGDGKHHVPRASSATVTVPSLAVLFVLSVMAVTVSWRLLSLS